MTPTATTPAGRGNKPKAGRPAATHPSAPSRTPRAPRRVSGPVSPRPSAQRSPQRRSETTPRRPRGRTRRPGVPVPLAARAGAFVRALPDHSLLDRIVRGRAWIPLLGVLLVGIVAMQVEVLKLSSSMGRSLQRGTALQSRNEQLRASVAELGDDQRIERIAASMGLVMPPPTAIKFLAPRADGQVSRALGNIHLPNASSFIAALPGSGAAAGLTTTSVPALGAVALATATTPPPTVSPGPAQTPTAGASTATPTVTPGVAASGSAPGAATSAGAASTGGAGTSAGATSTAGAATSAGTAVPAGG